MLSDQVAESSAESCGCVQAELASLGGGAAAAAAPAEEGGGAEGEEEEDDDGDLESEMAGIFGDGDDLF